MGSAPSDPSPSPGPRDIGRAQRTASPWPSGKGGSGRCAHWSVVRALESGPGRRSNHPRAIVLPSSNAHPQCSQQSRQPSLNRRLCLSAPNNHLRTNIVWGRRTDKHGAVLPSVQPGNNTPALSGLAVGVLTQISGCVALWPRANECLLWVKSGHCDLDPARARDVRSSLVRRTQYEVRITKSTDREIEARSRLDRLI
jgi:hypothetical protein